MAFMRVLAGLHRLDVAKLELPGFDRPVTPEENASLDLAMWAGLGRTVTGLDPLISYSGAYLVAHPPSEVPATCLIQGDTGPGNFLALDGTITGLCDMEFAHIGDPMDDLAWVTMRAGSLVDDLAPYFEEYSRCSGVPVLEHNLGFYKVAVQYRCAVTTSLAVARGGGARGWAPYLLVTQRYLRGLAREMCSYTGASDQPVELPEPTDTERTSWYDALLSGIRAGVRGIGDPALREETRNHQIFVHYLRAYDSMGPELARLEGADCVASTGIDAQDLPALDAAASRAGTDGDIDVLRYLLRRRQRIAHLWRTVIDR
jgi:hypothetical protein